ncbi:MAG: class I SAM-dependent methyltransferase [Deltaproteobacteria bacterium]|nr:class I SAM-dependent methyltransferase [Deltaproteobacteria bacterium]
MKREPIFNHNGAYNLVVRKKIMLHREARKSLTRELGNWSRSRGTMAHPARVLDLACGGTPVTISALMHALPERTFTYTGVDINADQVRQAKDDWAYPDNVVETTILKGNAWMPESLGFNQKFDIVFSGMNFHHAVPEELVYLTNQLRPLCADHAILLSHDMYRPESSPYVRRPKKHPTNPSEALELIQDLTESHIDDQTDLTQTQQVTNLTLTRLNSSISRGMHPRSVDFLITGYQVNWRHEFLRRYKIHLSDLGVSP